MKMSGGNLARNVGLLGLRMTLANTGKNTGTSVLQLRELNSAST